MNCQTVLELCAGAGGQSLGLEKAGFSHVALVEIDTYCCKTLRLNRPTWNILEQDLHAFDAAPYKGVDLLAGGLPCPPFSRAGKQLGQQDERNLFPRAIEIIDQVLPRAIMIENVRGFLDPCFAGYRQQITGQLESLGYRVDIRLLNAQDFGVPQARLRTIIMGLRTDSLGSFPWPSTAKYKTITVATALYPLLRANGWQQVDSWKLKANKVAPTIVGGSKKHGGPDLGPTRARRAWAELGIDGRGLADAPPEQMFQGQPRLTVQMAARIQGFPRNWRFAGGKTAAYRQVGNAFPPPVATAIGKGIHRLLVEQPEVV